MRPPPIESNWRCATPRAGVFRIRRRVELDRPQNAMIDNEIIAWLVNQLSDVDSLSEYSVEYGTALLMNLSLRCAALPVAAPLEGPLSTRVGRVVVLGLGAS